MGSQALIQTSIDADVKDRASAVLEDMGLTLSDAVRILLTKVADEGSFPLAQGDGGEAHDTWFRAKVAAALADPRPDVPDAEVERHFKGRREAALRKAGSNQP